MFQKEHKTVYLLSFYFSTGGYCYITFTHKRMLILNQNLNIKSENAFKLQQCFYIWTTKSQENISNLGYEIILIKKRSGKDRHEIQLSYYSLSKTFYCIFEC